MNNSDLENAYDQAIKMLQKGRSKEEVLLEFAQFKDELNPLLDLSLSFLTLPKLKAPQPAMQRKYALAPAKRLWLAWLHVSKLAGASISLMLLISAFAVTGYASLDSAPGQALFQIKKSEEKLQLLLAYNQQQKADLEIQIAQNRLSDAQQIFNNPQSNPAQQTAALTELADQTTNAVKQVDSVTKDNPKSNANSPLLASLENITQQQQALLTGIKSDAQIQAAASSALASLTQTTAKISEIKQLVAAADNDQTIITLSANPNSVAVLGDITSITPTQITVEKTTFELTQQTSVKDSNGNLLSFANLTSKIKVNVVGTKGTANLLAQEITVIVPDDSQPEVKGTSTSTTATSSTPTETSTPSSLKKTGPIDGQNQDNTNDASSTTQDNLGTATGGFIIESPAPQFSPN